MDNLFIDQTTKMFSELISEGLIAINEDGIIKIYNKKAMDVFRINLSIKNSHRSGTIEQDDIVIICNNSLGSDDGIESLEELESIGLLNMNLEKGDSFISISKYKNFKFTPILKKVNKLEKVKLLKLNYKLFNELDISCKIDFYERVMDIGVNEKVYSMRYINSIGHMLILDSKTKEVKFFQHYGYTARGESIKDIIKGKEYLAKGVGSKGFEVLEKHIQDIHKSNYIIQATLEVAKGKKDNIYNRFETINGIPTLCSILKLEIDNKVVGAALKVEDITELEKVIEERDLAINKLIKVEKELEKEEYIKRAFSNFIGNSDEIKYVKKLALKASDTMSNVLILGESGTGKSILARLIHENSLLKMNSFIEINCAAIPRELLESELFGYEKGAFTGARDSGKKGLLEMANEGSLFLDEIGDIPMSSQAKLLRVIQEGIFYPIGATKPKKVRTRIIAATNKNLEKEIKEGRFREDLYYRINVFPIYIPPLRDRKEDIYLLVDFIVNKLKSNMDIKDIIISQEAINKLINYDWPGNIRELENILERAFGLSDGKLISSNNIKVKESSKDKEIKSLKKYTRDEEKKYIKYVLNTLNGDIPKTIEVLGISRSSFYKKISNYNIKYTKTYK